MTKEYRVIGGVVSTSGADDVNKFLKNNPEWKLWNVITGHPGVVFVLERDAPDGPKAPGPNGGSTEAALLTESTNVIPLKRAA